MSEIEDRVKAAVKEMESRDQELARELRRVREERRAEAERLSPALESLPPVADISELALETIVLRTGRPVLKVLNDVALIEFTDADSEVWRKRLTECRQQMGHAIRAVGRINVSNHPLAWLGTGWLVAPDIIVTNRHVANEFSLRRGEAFVFRQGLGGEMSARIDFLEEHGSTERREFQLTEILHVEDESGFDVAFLRVEQTEGRGLAEPIRLSHDEAQEGQQVAVIGYPARDSRIPEQDLMLKIFGDVYDKKRLAPGQIIKLENELLLHDCSTLGGNSGSAVIELQSGSALALHFAGRFLRANYAVPAPTVAGLLENVRAGGTRRVRPAPDTTRLVPTGAKEQGPGPGAGPGQGGQGPRSATATATLRFDLPITLHLEVGLPVASARPMRPSAPSQPGTAPGPTSGQEEEEVLITEARPGAYANRGGYQSGFLGRDARVPLPEMSDGEDVLTFSVDGREERVLKYEHFSVVMSRSRRLCRFSAVNIDGRQARKVKRTQWKTDPRIPLEQQIIKECYGQQPMFSRGHMTRREDPVWGSLQSATLGNSDSMHVTNAVPQIQPFNAGIWLSLEDYALDNAKGDEMLISVFTGPFLLEDDPEHYGVQIPRTFWKVIAFIHDETGELCATGYELSQEDFLRTEEFVFGQHETAQVPLSYLEEKAGVSFGELTARDPLGQLEESRPMPLRDLRDIRFIAR